MATELLKQVWSRIEELPAAEQDALAGRMQAALDQIEEAEEAEWDALVASPASLRFLDQMAINVREARLRGNVRDLEEDL